MNVPLSLYVHLPWCVRKCPYCDFNSHTAGVDAPRARYLEALTVDLRHEAGRAAAARPLQSVFLGGGTPSLFSGAEIGQLLETVRRHFVVAEDIEITMEANPGSVERDKLAAYRDAGVNRLSLGAQSFTDASLARLGRVHTVADTMAAFAEARRAGFDNVNLDLMFALPGQTPAMALSDVEHALALRPEHVSYYQLTLEPNTVFFSRPPPDLPDEDAADTIAATGHAALRDAGFRQYEISAFARPGRACRHNLNYWTFGDYLGAGAGAHGKLTDDRGRIRRYSKKSHPLMYMQHIEGFAAAPPGAPPPLEADLETVLPGDVAFEYLLNALRLPGGFSDTDFHDRTGLSIDVIREQLLTAVGDGLMEEAAAGRWRPSEHGLRYLNDLQGRFLPRPASPEALPGTASG